MAKRNSIMLNCKNCKISWAVGFNRIRQNKITPCPVCGKISPENYQPRAPKYAADMVV